MFSALHAEPEILLLLRSRRPGFQLRGGLQKPLLIISSAHRPSQEIPAAAAGQSFARSAGTVRP